MGTTKPNKGKQKALNNAQSSETSGKHQPNRRKSSSKGQAMIHDSIPGVQKIKAALRQTKRLLAKDKLAADVRVTTERRLKSLEADLAKAELAKVERTMATRYHKVKFFERRKVLRKINQTKRLLESGTDEEGEKLSKKKRKELEKSLLERRVDLNYVLNYPKANKYISLFPSKSQKEGEGSDEDETVASPEADGALETSRKREELRNAIREAMQADKIEQEPELHLTDREKAPKHSANLEPVGDDGVEQKRKRKDSKKVEKARGGVDEDAFFEV